MVIPTGDPYLRPANPIATPGERLEMCSKALEDLSEELQGKVVVLDIETSRKGATYTFDTLQSLRAFFPKDEFTLVLGSDAAATFHKWKRSDDVRKQAEILVVRRQEKLSQNSKRLKSALLMLVQHKSVKILQKGRPPTQSLLQCLIT
jgi:nicotinate-nucleotide adenylyltransferase